MSYSSARLGLPLLQAGQAQKEVTHNEALTLLEALVQPVAQTAGDDTPPASPGEGQCWIVGGAPAGGWAGQAGALAMWSGGGWRFVPAFEGMAVWVAGANLQARRSGGVWLLGSEAAARILIGGVQVVGSRQAAIATPSGGTLIDAEARAALSAVIAALRSHGLISI